MQLIQTPQEVTGGYCYNYNNNRYQRQPRRYSQPENPRYNCNTSWQTPSYQEQPAYNTTSPYQSFTFNFYNQPASYSSWTVTWYDCY